MTLSIASPLAPEATFTEDELVALNSERGLRQVVRRGKNARLSSALRYLKYERRLRALQVELVKLQRAVQDENRRVVIIFEGRDAAGKGGAIRRFTHHLNPRAMRVVALPKPTDEEKGQWYFQRYVNQLPNPGEICFFDRSWYNRAVVEPVNGFCTSVQYERFMRQVPDFEHMLHEDGIELIKFWFSITRDEQERRFDARRKDPLKQWKLSDVDQKAQSLWDEYTHYKEAMFMRTHTSFAPWVIVKGNSKKTARLESIRYVLTNVPYAQGRPNVRTTPDPEFVSRYRRAVDQLDV